MTALEIIGSLTEELAISKSAFSVLSVVKKGLDWRRRRMLLRFLKGLGERPEEEVRRDLERLRESSNAFEEFVGLSRAAIDAKHRLCAFGLGLIASRILRDGSQNMDDLLFATVLEALHDIDLRVFHEVGRLSALQEWRSKLHSETHDKPPAGFRLEEEHLAQSALLRSLGLTVARIHVDRLVSSGVLSGDIGGYGYTGVAHGYLFWTEKSAAFALFMERVMALDGEELDGPVADF